MGKTKFRPMTDAAIAKSLANVDMAKAEKFVRDAIVAGRGEYKGLHTVYSGFNGAVRKVLNCDPIALTTALANTGKVVTIPRKGGVMLYLPEDGPKASIDTAGSKLLEKMGVKL